MVPLVVAGFPNKLPPFKPGGLLVLQLSQGYTLRQCPRLGRCCGSGRSKESRARHGGLLAKNTTAKWILLNGSEQSCRLPSKHTVILLLLGSTEDLGAMKYGQIKKRYCAHVPSFVEAAVIDHTGPYQWFLSWWYQRVQSPARLAVAAGAVGKIFWLQFRQW